MMDPFGGISYKALHRAATEPGGPEILRSINGGHIVERVIEQPVFIKKKKKKRKQLEAKAERKLEKVIEKVLAKKFGFRKRKRKK